MTPEEIADAYEDVSKGMVYAALDFYDEHPEEMEQLRRERTRAEQRLKDQSINND